MARLIVEEAGKRRAFKVGAGVLTVGTGADARLRVSAPDVAELHAELQLQGDGAVLRPRPGVLPPTVGGRSVTGETPIGFGEEVRVGSVRMWLEDESQPAGSGAPPPAEPAAAPAAQAAAPARGGGPVSAADRELRRQQAMARARRSGDRSVVQRSRPRVKRGVPGSVIAILIVAAVTVAGFAGWRMFQSGASGPRPVAATLAQAREYLRDGAMGMARKRLDAIAAQDLNDRERRELGELEERYDELVEQAAIDREHMRGTQYLDTKLRKYQEYYLTGGTPSSSRARVFLKRCREFKERWPRHPERDWVERQERRFREVVDLSQPPTLEDVAWEVECLTKTNPKFYAEAFGILDAFIETASGADLTAAQELRGELVEQRQEDFRDRMLQAEYELNEKDDAAKSVLELVAVIIRYGNEAMTNEAAGYLLKMPNLDAHLRGRREFKPAEWALLIEHPMVGAYVRENGLLEE